MRYTRPKFHKAPEFIYCVRDKASGKIVSGLTNPNRRVWLMKGAAQNAVDHENRHGADYEVVTFKLVEVLP